MGYKQKTKKYSCNAETKVIVIRMLKKKQSDLESLNGYIGHNTGRTVFTARSAPVLFIAPTEPL